MRIAPLQTQPVDSIDIKEHISELTEKLTTTPFNELLMELLHKAIHFGLKVLAAVLIYTIGVWLIRKSKTWIAKLFLKKNTDATIVSFIQSITSIALTILLIVITIGILGVDTTSIVALLAGGGMAIGLALNGTVQNFAGGMMIIAFKPFKAGDYIEAQGYEGTVSEVNIVNTRLTTVDNRSIIIPNGALFNGTINNYSEKDLRRLDWAVSVEYGADVNETKEVLKSLLENDSRILNTSNGGPADPFVALSELADSSVKFVMRGWVKSSDYWDVKFNINEKIYEELPKRGIRFPFPQMDVHVHQD